MLKYNDMRDIQNKAAEFLYERDEGLLLGDVGSGKTVIALTAISWLLDDYPSEGFLVLAPQKVCQLVWQQEAEKWAHLEHLSFAVLSGRSPQARRKMLCENHHIYLANYELIPWLCREFPNGFAQISGLWFDELDKLKDRRTARFKGQTINDRGKRVRVKGIQQWRKNFNLIYGMTGTPNSRHYLDLWAEVFCLDGGRTLGSSFSKFRQEYFYQTDYMGYSWAPFETTKEKIFDKLAPFTFRIESYADLPALVELPPRIVEFPKDAYKRYREMEKHCLTRFGDGDVVKAINSAVAYGKLRQATAGFMYDEEKTPKTTSLAKFQELASLLSELQGQQAVIVYHYQEELATLYKQYNKRIAHLGGNQTKTDAMGVLTDFRKGKLELLALHPQSAGHGIDGLQDAGCRHIIMLTAPETAGLYRQVIGRLRRTGQKADAVFVHRIHVANTIDQYQDARVHERVEEMQELLDEMKKRTEVK